MDGLTKKIGVKEKEVDKNKERVALFATFIYLVGAMAIFVNAIVTIHKQTEVLLSVNSLVILLIVILMAVYTLGILNILLPKSKYERLVKFLFRKK